MKTLILARHAKAVHDGSARDHDRALDPRGERDALRMGGFLAEHACLPDAILSSTAVRAADTARRFAAGLGLDPAALETDARIYDAGVHDLLRIIRETDDRVSTLLVVGHNPTISLVAGGFIRHELSMHPAEFIALTFPVEGWMRLSFDGCCTTLHHISPKSLAD